MSSLFNRLNDSPLGKKSPYATHYNADFLFPIARSDKRKELDLDLNNLPFYGRDLWYAYELSWLNAKGKPIVRIAVFELPYDSPNIIESKSFKLYLNTFNQSVFANELHVKNILEKDLTNATGSIVKIKLMTIPEAETQGFHSAPGTNLDDLDIVVADYHYSPALLKKADGHKKETLYSHLLKSNCLVTGQPDWGTLVIEYEGEALNHESLLRYICSFRQHHEFHEQCVERIFTDLIKTLNFEELTVYAQYVRRGGLDISPWRSTKNHLPENLRFIRQ